MTIEKNSLFQLTPKEFEILCVEILRAQGIERVEFVGGRGDQGADIIGETKGQQIVVQVKHTKQLLPSIVRRIIDQVKASSYQPKELIIMTSAVLSPSLRKFIKETPSEIDVKLIGQDEILRILKDHPEIQRLQIAPARRRTIRQRWELILGFIGILSSIAALLISGITLFVKPEKPKLQERIETVERAIGSLRDLEKQLIGIRGDMVETEKAAKVIEQEYAKAKELEKLTQEQYEAVKSALWSRSWQKTALNYGLGFVLGIGSSLIASVVYSRFRQYRALREESNNA